MIPKSFASDNNSGVHPQIMEALTKVNMGHYTAYGDDPFTAQAEKEFKKTFGNNIVVYFVYNGTAANVISLKTITNSFNSIICAGSAHINVDECGAPEHFTGCKLLDVDTNNGKITKADIYKHLIGIRDPHHAQPKVVSITQSTEMGTLYGLDEIKEICDYAHENNLIVHMDGARIANAAVALNCSLKNMTADVGIDVLSFGGTKNGMMFGEAVVFFNKELSKNFEYFRKQGMQLSSKMRYISAQFISLLENDLWYENARHANYMAKILAKKLSAFSQIKISQKTQVNAVFAKIPHDWISILQEKYFFYIWDEHEDEVRFMTSFDTTEEDIENFINEINKLI